MCNLSYGIAERAAKTAAEKSEMETKKAIALNLIRRGKDTDGEIAETTGLSEQTIAELRNKEACATA